MSKSDAIDKAAIQRRVDRYLKEVDEVLKRSGSSWHDRNSVLDNIQTQIREMLAQCASGNPTVQDAEAVIAELDPPDTYAPELPEGELSARENPLRPLYLVLSYLFLFFFIICIASVIMPLILRLAAPKTELMMSVAILPLLIQIIFAAIFFRIANMFNKAAKKK